MRAAVRGWSPVIMITRMPARCASRMATPASSRGGSMMPTVPTKIRSRSSVGEACGSSPGVERPVGHGERAQRRVGQRRRRRPGCARAARRRARRRPCPTRARVQRSSSTSGAPLVITHDLVAVLVVALDRRHHLAVGRERDLADALEAPLAPLGARPACARPPGRPPRSGRPGSPIRRPPVWRRSALPARLPPLSTTMCSARSGPAVELGALVLDPPLGRVARPR